MEQITPTKAKDMSVVLLRKLIYGLEDPRVRHSSKLLTSNPEYPPSVNWRVYTDRLTEEMKVELYEYFRSLVRDGRIGWLIKAAMRQRIQELEEASQPQSGSDPDEPEDNLVEDAYQDEDEDKDEDDAPQEPKPLTPTEVAELDSKLTAYEKRQYLISIGRTKEYRHETRFMPRKMTWGIRDTTPDGVTTYVGFETGYVATFDTYVMPLIRVIGRFLTSWDDSHWKGERLFTYLAGKGRKPLDAILHGGPGKCVKHKNEEPFDYTRNNIIVSGAYDRDEYPFGNASSSGLLLPRRFFALRDRMWANKDEDITPHLVAGIVMQANVDNVGFDAINMQDLFSVDD